MFAVRELYHCNGASLPLYLPTRALFLLCMIIITLRDLRDTARLVRAAMSNVCIHMRPLSPFSKFSRRGLEKSTES